MPPTAPGEWLPCMALEVARAGQRAHSASGEGGRVADILRLSMVIPPHPDTKQCQSNHVLHLHHSATPWMYVAKVMDRCRDAEARGRLEVMVAVMTEIALGRFTTGPRGTRRLLPGSRGSPASSSRPSSRPSSLPSSLPGSVHGGVAAAHLLRASRLGTPHAPPHVLSDGLLSRFAPRMERIREEARAEVAAEEDP